MNLSSDVLHLAAQLAAPAFFSLIATAGMGALVLSLVSETTGLARGTAFPDKLAQQLSSMAMCFLAIACTAFAAGGVLLGRNLPWLTDWLFASHSPALPFCLTWGVALLLTLLYRLTWKGMRNNKALHLVLGGAAALAAVATIPAGVIIAPEFLAAFSSGIAPENITPTLPLADSPVWPFTLQYLILGLANGGGLGALYLIYRRHKDNYGRDYYNFALPFVVTGGVVFMFLQLAGPAWLLLGMNPEARSALLASTLAPVLYAGVGAALLCCLLWLPVMRSATPLRFKGLAVLGGLLAWGVQLTALLLSLSLLAP
ncbi:MAG: hypothetical protein V3573_03060 [Desulfovibrionaceae bacterium]